MASFQLDRVVLTGRVAIADSGRCTASDCCWDYGEVGLLAGYGTRAGGRWNAHAGLGLGYGSAPCSGGPCEGVRLLVESQVAWRLSRFFGVALVATGDPAAGLLSVGCGATIGRLR